MNQFLPVLSHCPLFRGIEPSELSGMLACLGAKTVFYAKGQTIFCEGEKASHLGIVLSGAVQVIREDYYGNRSIVAQLGQTQLFGESFACAGVSSLPVSVTAVEECQIMLIDCKRIVTTCSSACSFHNQVVLNLLRTTATKNLMFNQKLEILSKRTTRDKLMAFLMLQAKQHDSNSFTIPYNRQALADYLGVDRSAMAAEISKLRKDGIIECTKSHFVLL